VKPAPCFILSFRY